MSDDRDLLRSWTEERDQASFTELVRRHVNLVYSVALRKVGGDAHLAQDVAQRVFADLARKAPALSRHPTLTGWLFTSTHFAATQLVRSERRRRTREEKAQAMNELFGDSVPTHNWDKLRPLLDDVVLELSPADREAILLRFFADRTFPEIAARLQLSEDGARARVNRAIDKLQALLARRGVTSTSSALALALSQHAVATAPAGLAASLAASAVSSASVAGLTGAAAVKFSVGTLAALGALGLSLGGNIYLLRGGSPPLAATAATPVAQTAVSLPPAPLALVAQADLTLLRDQLRARRVSEESIRAALEGLLRRRYREQLSEMRRERAARGWWRDPQRTWGIAASPLRLGDDARLLREMVTQPLEQLLGPDPLQVAEAEARYAFLPPEIRNEFARLERQRPVTASPTGDPVTDLQFREETEAERKSAERKRAELVAVMTPAQRAEYELRFAPFAASLARQLEHVDVTEQEFRTIFPVADAHAKQLASRSGMDARRESDQQTADRLVAALGYDRGLEVIWSRAMEFPSVARLAREQNLPPNTAGRTLQLAAQTAEKAQAVHVDATLPAEQKRAALLVLQREARAQLDALIPPAAQKQLPPTSLQWLTDLSEGRYKTITSALPGHPALSISYPVDVTHRPPDKPVKLLIPRRPARG